ncbi:glycosyltransferase family 2 protein [Campylobacter sp. RM16192]|uniref:glycosyltransferase family 2 protein n=1 Tax=Campylobacter sp. RM16192 TaxID=1660080 RepID=UPI0014513636|nr:glycosyltransferase family 2 protein [Campylobacter sp. RM16192]QCD52721.1 glycosyltransferase, family 2 [Campylobacter sp. RM16192]
MSKYAFLIPFYNHPERINELIEALKAYKLDIIIVDDGSDEASKEVLKGIKDILLLERKSNGGKGAAMKDGFKFAIDNGFTHVLQVDADFQHDVSMIDEFLEISNKFPKDIICANPIYDNTAPKSRVYGRKITNFWVAINTLSLKIKDAMCGFRIYPLKEIEEAIKISKTNRMEFDIEILVNAHRCGLKTQWIDIRVSYQECGISHFKMLRDNAMISLMHARGFFSLPKFIFQELFSKNNSELWWKKNEKSNSFFLRLTLILTQYLPVFLLNFVIKIVVFFYYLTSKEERENIEEFRRNLANFAGENVLKNTSVFGNFYQFGVAICDKFRVWKGKIGFQELDIVNVEYVKTELTRAKRGQILLTAHLGNIEICKKLATSVDGFAIVILAYDENVRKFNDIINEISGEKIRILLVNELDVRAMLELKTIVDSGTHIGIMGDRVPINGDKFTNISFLGKEAKFNHGPYIIAGILGVKISSLWCQKINDKFRIEFTKIADEIKLSRDKVTSVRPYLKNYVNELEHRCKQTPEQWFNFYDFWRQ